MRPICTNTHIPSNMQRPHSCFQIQKDCVLISVTHNYKSTMPYILLPYYLYNTNTDIWLCIFVSHLFMKRCQQNIISYKIISLSPCTLLANYRSQLVSYLGIEKLKSMLFYLNGFQTYLIVSKSMQPYIMGLQG